MSTTSDGSHELEEDDRLASDDTPINAVECPVCQGEGVSEDQEDDEDCRHCDGKGYLRAPWDVFVGREGVDRYLCPECGGGSGGGGMLWVQCPGCADFGVVSKRRADEIASRHYLLAFRSPEDAREAQDDNDLTFVDLALWDLRELYFPGARMRDKDLSGRDLTGAELDGADLQGADLRGAVLRDAGLVETAWAGTRLDGADLTGAYLKGSDLHNAESMSGALLVNTDGLTDEQRAVCRAKGAVFG